MKFLLPYFLSICASLGVVLAWDANPEPDIEGYILYWGEASRQYTNARNVGNVTDCIVDGLVIGSRYYFVLTAFNTSGLEGDPSSELDYTVRDGGFCCELSRDARTLTVHGNGEVRVEYSPDGLNWFPLVNLRVPGSASVAITPDEPRCFYRTVKL